MAHEIENNLIASLVVDATQVPFVILAQQGIDQVFRGGNPAGDFVVVLTDQLAESEETTSCATFDPGGASQILHSKPTPHQYAIHTIDETGALGDSIFAFNVFRVRTGS